MNKTLNKKFALIIFSIITVIAGIEMYKHSQIAFDFSATGIVVETQWNSPNHNMPLFTIRESNGNHKYFHASNIKLQPGQIRKGDTFSKESGSRSCSINGVNIPCVE